jgi:CubicO group peptidase (beta-lactamase class C family)
LTPGGLRRFGEIARSHVSDHQVPGVVALVARGDRVHVEAHGTLSIGGSPVRRDSLFRISATSTPIVGAVTLALVREGLLDIEEPVDRLLPELADRRVLRRMDGPLNDTVPASRAITVRDLLTGALGFGAAMEMYTATEDWPIVVAESELPLATIGPPDPEKQADPDAWMAALGSLPLICQPGERWMNNTSASVLGVLLSRAAGEPLAEVYRRRLFEPLGMQDTAFFAADTSRLATAYSSAPEGLQVWDPPDGKWCKAPAFGDAASGLVSTVDDLWAFARMLLSGGHPVATADAVAEMTCDQLTAAQKQHGGPGSWWPGPRPEFRQDRTWGFCLSIITTGRFTGAFGWDGGLGSTWLVDPAHDLTVIVLAQRLFDGPNGAPAVHSALQEAAYEALPDVSAGRL